MQVGEVIFILLFNCLVIFGLFILQQKSLEKKIKHLNKDVQDLEDLVAAIIEEFEEIATTTESKISLGQSALPPTTAAEKVNLEVEVEPESEPLMSEIEELKLELVQEDTFLMTSEILEQNSNHQTQQPSVISSNTVNQRPVNDPKHQKVLDLWESGNTIEDIAKQLGVGRGEIQLILGIYRRS